MGKKFSPFTVRLLSRIIVAVILLFSLLLALLLLPLVLFIICVFGVSLLAIYLVKKFLSPKKPPPSEYYDLEIHPITDAELEESLDEMQKKNRGKKIERP